MRKVGEIVRGILAKQALRRELAKTERLYKINRPHKVSADGKTKVVDDDGHVYGTHDTDAQANEQIKALYAAKGRGE